MSIEARAQQYLAENGKQSISDRNYIQVLRQKWGRLVGDIKNPNRQAVAAVLMENQMGHLKSLNEETLSTGVGSFTKYIFPILRRVFPNLIANEIMSVQPMSAPIGAVFYYEYKHASTKGGITAGENLVEEFNKFYSAEKVDEESIGTGNAATVTFTGNLQWTPVRPLDADYGFAVTVTAASITGVDDGSGTIAGSGIASGSINYTTGSISVTFSVAPAAAVPVVVEYYYNSESNAVVPEVNLDITMGEIRAVTRKLKTRWSAEASDDLRAFHGIDAETEMVAGIANEIALEIDREMIDMLISNAQTTTTYTYSPAASSVGEMDTIRALLTKVSAVSAKIHRLSKRAPANFIVTTPEVVALLEQLTTHGDYRPSFQVDNSVFGGPLDPGSGSSYGPLTSNFGVMRVGTLMNKWAVYQDPFLSQGSSTKTMLVGLKGNTFMDAGAVYAPYVPLQVTPTFLDPDDFSFRKGMRTRYGKKMLRTEYYGTIDVSGLPVT
jgi:hypothetical protein